MESGVEETKLADRKWQKKAGLDLCVDKTKILKEDFSKAQRDGREVPKTNSAQLFKGRTGNSRMTKIAGTDWKRLKRRALRKLCNLGRVVDAEERGKRLRKIEGLLYEVVKMSGTYEEEEADRIVDFYVRYRERPGCHPLQTTRVSGVRLGNSSRKRSVLFSHPPLHRALARRGFYLNTGPFSPSESTTLLKNFNAFLASKGLPTDSASIWNLMKDNFFKFYRENRLFLYVGDNLNRTSDQLYRRLLLLVHTHKRDRITAEETAVILDQADKLKSQGVHRYCKRIGEKLDRFHIQISSTVGYVSRMARTQSIDAKRLIDLVSLLEEASPSPSLENLPFDSLAEKLGCGEEELERYWHLEGKRKYQRSKLPAWTLEDSDKLLDVMLDTGEDEENCVDFEKIYAAHFRGKVVDRMHLREHFARIRRVVPYYMLDDLRSVVVVAKKDIAEKLKVKKDTDRGDAP